MSIGQRGKEKRRNAPKLPRIGAIWKRGCAPGSKMTLLSDRSIAEGPVPRGREEVSRRLYQDPAGSYPWVSTPLSAPTLAASLQFCSSKQLEIRDSDNSLMAVVSGKLPDSIRQSLCRDLMLCFDDEGEELLHLMDTKKDGDPFFQTVHLSWYNRYATKVSTLLYAEASKSWLMFYRDTKRQ